MSGKVQDKTASERFWEKVSVAGDCWLWSGYIKPNGYASFYPGGGRHVSKVYAHRFSYELHAGEKIPDGMEIDHSCNVRHCVNPAHLEPVTHRGNLDRAVERRTHCKNGHPFSGDNLYMWRGNRFCSACRVAAERRKRERMSIVRGV